MPGNGDGRGARGRAMPPDPFSACRIIDLIGTWCGWSVMVLDGECRGLELISETGDIEYSGPGHNLRLMAVSTVDRGCRLALRATGKRLVFPGAIDLDCLEF